MRLFSLILSLYMAFLLGLPCADNQECHANDGVQKITEAKSHQDHTHETESCSPLCVCMCCTSYAYFKEFKQELTPRVKLLTAEFSYRPSLYAFHFHSIWQPPKIG